MVTVVLGLSDVKRVDNNYLNILLLLSYVH